MAIIYAEMPDLTLLSRGKVRDIFAWGDDALVIVTTDRISAFDVIMPDPIPDKGKILNELTIFWMRMMADIIRNHIIADRVEVFPPELAQKAAELKDRTVLAKRAQPLPIECIVRGYITGSSWKDYQASGQVSGHLLPAGLQESQALDEPIFTPSTKAEVGGHDENITEEQAAAMVGKELYEKVKRVSLSIYKRAVEYGKKRGIIIADTKFEFGLNNGELILIDEVLTPDSSRFWPEAGFRPGESQPSFDKQYLRDWLDAQGFKRNPPAPALPEEVIRKTREKYIEAFKLLTGRTFLG